MDSSEKRKLRNRAERLTTPLVLLSIPLVILFLVFGLPLVGNFAVLALADSLGCTVNASKPHACYLFGHDIGVVVYNYAMTYVIAGITNPLLFFSLLTAALPDLLVLAWFAAIFILYMLKREAETKASRA